MAELGSFRGVLRRPSCPVCHSGSSPRNRPPAAEGANKLYENCRAGALEVSGFPEFKHLLGALQNVASDRVEDSYQVSIRKHDRLLVPSSIASKFLESEELKDDAKTLIEEHNESYSKDGDLQKGGDKKQLKKIYFIPMKHV